MCSSTVGDQTCTQCPAQATQLLAAHADRGPSRLLQHPELKLLWRTEFGGAAEVPWDKFFGAFPAGIARLPGLGMPTLAEKLGGLLATDAAKAAFKRFVRAADNVTPIAGAQADVSPDADGISCYALAAAFGAPLTDTAAAGLDDLANEVRCE
jgi:hypothetical protein